MRGFAGLSPEKRKELGRRGGQSSQRQGKGRLFVGDIARELGKKGGEKTSQNQEHMANIGRLGGMATAKNKK